MERKVISVKKYSGEIVPFSIEKLKKSLKNSGASPQEIEKIIIGITPELYDEISTKVIYKKAFYLLKNHNRTSASKYSLKRAIFDLGPTGYPFEKLIGAILKQKGYKTKVGEILNGEYITHEIDVLAEKDGDVFTVECKFHKDSSAVNNVKIPLYINSRFLDVQKVWNNSEKKTTLKQGWVVSNTRFSKDAIAYAKGVDLTLLSWNYPVDKGIKERIDQYALYPITALTTLTKRNKTLLIENDIILVKELYNNPDSLHQLSISEKQKGLVLAELSALCNL